MSIFKKKLKFQKIIKVKKEQKNKVKKGKFKKR